MEDQYGMGDLKQFMNAAGWPLFSSATVLPPQPPEQLLDAGHHYEMMGRQPPSSSDMIYNRTVVQFHSSAPNFPAAGTITSATCMSNASLCGLEMDIDGLGGDAATGRWPRQETLTLLDIRSRLDSMFKEANQKAPLWDEVSRIMSEEHGYQRSGKKCREKFENLYKYYKKTKEGKAGRQDGKHYRFFRQLEALYGETSNSTSVSETHGNGSTFPYNVVDRSFPQHNQEAHEIQAPRLSNSLTLSNSSGFDTSSSEESDLNAATLMESNSIEKILKRRAGKRSLKALKDFIDAQMGKLMEKQEEWMEKIMKTIEDKEQERILREKEWRRQEEARIDREHKLWAKERAWIEARDAAMMETLKKVTGKELKELEEIGVNELRSLRSNQTDNGSEAIINILKGDSWPEFEITKLCQLRNNAETSFQQIGC